MIDQYGNTHRDDVECLDDGGETPCEGAVELRPSLTGTGLAIPRCHRHWIARLDLEDEINDRYPVHAPSNFSYYDAGEHWGEDDY